MNRIESDSYKTNIQSSVNVEERIRTLEKRAFSILSGERQTLSLEEYKLMKEQSYGRKIF